jgi:hypothetical protein
MTKVHGESASFAPGCVPPARPRGFRSRTSLGDHLPLGLVSPPNTMTRRKKILTIIILGLALLLLVVEGIVIATRDDCPDCPHRYEETR